MKSGFEGHVRNVAKPVHRALNYLTGTQLNSTCLGRSRFKIQNSEIERIGNCNEVMYCSFLKIITIPAELYSKRPGERSCDTVLGSHLPVSYPDSVSMLQCCLG